MKRNEVVLGNVPNWFDGIYQEFIDTPRRSTTAWTSRYNSD